MGFIKALLFFIVIYWAIKLLFRVLLGSVYKRSRFESENGKETKQPEKTPETQEDRILDYQRKNFEATDAVDVDFEEIKLDE